MMADFTGSTRRRAVNLSTLLAATALPGLYTTAQAQDLPANSPAAATPAAPATVDAPTTASVPLPSSTQPARTGEDLSSTQEILVTGSRAAIAGFDAPTPTSVVSAAAVAQRQVPNIAQLLDEIPSFRATGSPAANAIRTQLPGSNTADLRGLGAQRTLVLVDGMRVPPLAAAITTFPVSVDLNQIPTLMVDRVEVVTGGASAQWGSDAVAGVVNIILKNKFEGLEVRAQGGVSDQGDAFNYRVAVLGGLSFDGGRGHIVAGFDFEHRDMLGDIYSRSWGRKEYGRVANSAYATNGQPASIVASGVHLATAPGGLITSGPLRNYTFLPDGSVRPYALGTIRDASFMIGGEGRSFARNISLTPGVQRFDPYLHIEEELSDALTVFAEASYAISRGSQFTLPPRDSAVTISPDNAFLTPAVRAATGGTSFTISRVDYDIGNTRVEVKNRTPHVALGGKGDLGGDWSWDAHVGWGKNLYRLRATDNRIVANYRFATDAVLNNGQIVCRATVPGPQFNAAAAGCVPINLFGDGSPSAAAKAYVTGTGFSHVSYLQETAAANLRGKPFSTWAGPVSLAVGGEYRREKQKVSGDPISVAGGFSLANGTAYSGKFDVKEAYAETIIPLAKDVPFLHALDLNGAVRVAKYSASGTQTTWKAGATWEPVAGVRFRGTRSRDIRAPAIFELYAPGTLTFLPATIGSITAASIPQNYTAGTPTLQPEKAQTTTVGVVLQPRFAPGTSLSVDYYDINLKNAITSITGTAGGQLCASGNTYFCSLLTYGPGGVPTAYNGTYINAAAIRTKGLDVVGSYRLPLSRVSSLPGDLTFAFSGTYTFHVYTNLGTGATIDYAGENSFSGTPRFRSNSSVTYRLDGFSATAQLTTTSRGLLDATANLNAATSINNNHVPAVQYVNLQASYQVNDHFQIFGSVNNLLDKDPPVAPSTTFFTVTNGTFYDVVGRAFQIGVDIKL